jgi:hypothetical protein
MKIDAQTLSICKALLFIHHEEEALVEHDPYAPEEGTPNHARHQALLAEWATLAEALTKAAPPTTLKGIRVLAEFAMTLADRTFEERLCEPKDFADWLTLFALTSAAGKPETIPLPDYLPAYWPA